MIDDASMDTKFDDFAKRERPTLGTTDTAAHRDAMDASKNRNWKTKRQQEERERLISLTRFCSSLLCSVFVLYLI